jgi:hypothetical protein
MKKGKLSFIIISLLLAAFIVSPASAAKKKARAKAAPRTFVLDVSLGLTYDDNIIRYSDADLDLFSVDSLPGKFSIKSKSDWIMAPQIRPRIQGRLIGNQPATLTLGYDYFGYVRNDVRRYSRFIVELRQDFLSRGYAQISYGYVPKYYYRNLFVRHDSIGGDIYEPAHFSKNTVGVEIGYDITKTIKGSVAYQFLNKSYDKIFNYRDLTQNGFDITGIWRAAKPLKFWGIYGYENAKAKGADLPDSVLDLSYIAWDLTFGVRHYAAFLPRFKPEFYTSFQFRRIMYQSDKPPANFGRNAFQFARNDNNYLLHLGAACQVAYKLHLDADYAFSTKRSSLPDLYPDTHLNIPQTTRQLEKMLNYSANTISLKLSRQF